MDCQKCQDLLSEFLEGSLAGDEHSLFSTHLEECLSCVDVRREMESIVTVAREFRDEVVAPPNSRALWLRIRNTIESDLEAERRVSAAGARLATSTGEGFWQRLMGKRWELSLPQLAAAVSVLAIIVATATAFGLKSLPGGGQMASGAETGTNRIVVAGNFDDASDALYHQTYLQQQEVRINYWKQHIEERKASWNPQMRVSFERSVSAYDEAINEAVNSLQRNPRDEVSREYLNAALSNKMELLKEFSEQ